MSVSSGKKGGRNNTHKVRTLDDTQDLPYKVSVSIITYNQKEYIQRAVEGALMQETDFPFEIIIGDDGSTDGTRKLLKDYQERYPGKIRLHLHEEHWDEGIAGRLNNITNIRSTRGKYIAFCDGDDYWLSSDKLQRQADFMDRNPEYSFCFHDALLSKQGESQHLYSQNTLQLNGDQRYNLEDLIRRTFIVPSSSMFFCTSDLIPIPEWFWNVYSADYALQLIAAAKGPSYFIKNLLSVQYKNENSVTSVLFSEENYEAIHRNDHAIFSQILGDKSHYLWNIDSKILSLKASRAIEESKFLRGLKLIISSICKDSLAAYMILQKVLTRLRLVFLSSGARKD